MIRTTTWLASTLLVMASGYSIADDETYFRGWQYKPEVVQDNVDTFNKVHNADVDYATVTGDYPALMEKSLIAKDKLDILYANPPTAVRFYEAGWLMPVNELDKFEDIKKDIYPNVLDAWTYDGKLLGLSYFLSVRGLVAVNKLKLKELGLDESHYPKNWDEFYDHVLALHNKGVKDVYLPHWFNEFYGISWAFIWEVLNRGEYLIDPKTKKPNLKSSGVAAETLRDWKALWKSGAVPEEVLSYTESGIVDGFASGRYLYSAQAAYNIAYFNNPQFSKMAGNVSFLPYQGQSWGLLDSALYLATNRDRSKNQETQTRDFWSWYGYKNHDDKFFVAQRWMNESMLFSAYKPVMESAETQKAMKGFLASESDYQNLVDLYAQTPNPNGVWKVLWAEEFNSWLRKRLSKFLLDDQPVDETLADMRAQIEKLNKKYGI